MKKKAAKTPRRNRIAERLEYAEYNLKSVVEERDKATGENDRMAEGIARACALLATERDELLARAAKCEALIKTLGERVDDGFSPSGTYIKNFTGRGR